MHNIFTDNHFELYASNNLLARGPSKGARFHWKYKISDFANYLQTGASQLPVSIHQGGGYRPEVQVTHQTGPIFQTNSEQETLEG